MARQKVYFSQDGSIDDFIALLAFLMMKDVELIGIGVINADCYLEAGISVTRKMLDVFGSYSIEVAASDSRPVNQFPNVWREHAYIMDALPILNESEKINAPLVQERAHTHMIRKLRESSEKVTVFCIGPLTDLARALKAAPDIESKIDRVVWMGGSFTGSGNVIEPDHDGSAEWNAFWDPDAVADVLSYKMPVIMVALHATNQCLWDSSMGDYWAKFRKHKALDFAGQSYAIVSRLGEYYFWDVLAAVYVGNPNLMTTKDINCTVHTEGRSSGRIEETRTGRKVTIVDKVDAKGVFDYLTELFKSFEA